jgi:hypothetical protein
LISVAEPLRHLPLNKDRLLTGKKDQIIQYARYHQEKQQELGDYKE